jgi:hypothetical protein
MRSGRFSPMQGLEVLSVFLDRLNNSGLSYMVTGSVASIIYGEPRMTHDVDLVLELHAEKISEFIDLFPISKFYCPPKEAITTEIARQSDGHFNIVHHDSGFKADIYPAGRDEFHKWAMAKRKMVQMGKLSFWIAPPEYVIIRKLQYYKEGQSTKHLDDVKKMLEISKDAVDKSVLEKMAEKYDVLEQWHLAQDID